MAGVFHVVARMARSSDGTHAAGAAIHPKRSPVATLFDRPDTYTVDSGASAASGAGASPARNA